MRKTITCIFIWAVSLVVSCGPVLSIDSDKARVEIIANAKKEVPYVKDFLGLFPSAAIGIYSKSFQKGTTTIQLIEIVQDRYRFTVTGGIEVDPKTLKIAKYETPLITLVEITLIEGKAEGPLSETHGANFKISQDQWKKIVESGGLFSGAGVSIKTNAPVEGIEKLRAYLKNSFAE